MLAILTYFVVQFSVRENLLVVTGNPDTKHLKDMLGPDMLRQVGPKQFALLKDLMKDMGKVQEAEKGDEDDDEDPPELVGTNFEEASK